ncbi:MAG: M20/M25/M40 family metallo-hydrolase [Oscillospiraceae bacterium]|nr:M20/M25/M40 family metallo-hydrolase [Oscillospiraceae bacterium]
MQVTKKLQPQAFFYWFEAISRIPHGSGKEQKLAAWLAEFADARSIPCETDEAGNVFMTLPASRGYENEPPILLQAHMDMVWKKDDGVRFHFEKDAIRLRIEGDHLTADGTTLGADNAVGMATMLALADDPAIPHPPLELLFTVEEETGLHGARKFDKSRIRARRMLNMDCGYTDVLCVSSAGKISGAIDRTFAVSPCSGATELAVTGGFSVHLAHIAKAEHACVNNIVGALLRDMACRLVSLTAPTHNSLAAVTAVVCGADRAELRRRMTQMQEKYRATNPELALTLSDAPDGDALSEQDTQLIAAALCTVRGGNYSPTPDRITTSGALRGLKLEGGVFHATVMARSLSDPDAERVFAAWRRELREYGFELRETDRYPAWPERDISPLRGKFERAHKRLLGTDVTYSRAMGGTDAGVIVGAIPDMDTVGYAPSSYGAHTTAEHLEISQVQPFWDVLLAVLAEKEGELA